MILLTAKSRKESGKQVKKLRNMGILPGVLYGPKTKSQNLEINQKEFDKVFRQAGESSLISLDVDKKKFMVLIHQVQLDPITSNPIHVDFLLPSLTEEISAKVPLVFIGEAPAVKELGGTFVKNISEIDVKALPEKLPHEIKVDVTSIKTFEDSIFVKNLVLPEGVKAMKGQDDIIAFVASPQKIEEELEKPIEEKVEEVGKVEKQKKEEEPAEEKETKEAAKKPAK
jgi:large subunit ribosomal protein L25